MALTEREQPSAEDWGYQEAILQDVSRTFALTIPTLPPRLRAVVGNAYLLCRIADTIEDDTELPPADKRAQAERFVAVVEGSLDAGAFAAGLAPRLGARTPPRERDLVANTPRVTRITHAFTPAERAALARCVRIMSRGMADYQDRESLAGLADLAEMGDYCYHVAGVVGEMLTELFCAHSPDIAHRREALMPLAVSFGQALQMTNILKDMWEDRRRGACWLPRSVFAEQGLELERLGPEASPQAFGRVLERLLAVAHHHLRNALRYTLMLPAREKGIRRFCLWALGMAVLTLRRIHANPDFRSGQEVKISRRSVKLTVALTSLLAGNDRALQALFALAARTLPTPDSTEGIAALATGHPVRS